MTVCRNRLSLVGARLTLLVTRLQGTLAIYHVASAFGLPATAKPLASLLLTIAIAIVLDHTFLSPSLTRVAPHARRIRHHATPCCTRLTIEPQRIPNRSSHFNAFSTISDPQPPPIGFVSRSAPRVFRRVGCAHLPPLLKTDGHPQPATSPGHWLCFAWPVLGLSAGWTVPTFCPTHRIGFVSHRRSLACGRHRTDSPAGGIGFVCSHACRRHNLP
jgi:hypothetical protein